MKRIENTTLPALLLMLMLCVPVAAEQMQQPFAGKARLFLVMVLDGLRPDSINPRDTPNIYRLREEGVNFVNSHAVFPTATRINAAAIATGVYPGVNGILSNNMYVRAYDAKRSFSVGEYRNLLRLEEKTGRIMFVKSVSEILHEHGFGFASVGSSSHASAFLSVPKARQGIGMLVHGYLEPGELVAFPDQANREILSRFGPAPPKEAVAPNNRAVDWTMEVFRRYVLPAHKPAVVYLWPDEPDHTQHAYGVGSPEARDTLRNNDRNIGLILDDLKELGLLDTSNIFLMSDHGFSLVTHGINVDRELIGAGLKAGTDSDDVVTASSGQSLLIHVKDRDPGLIQKIIAYLQAQDWTGALFTAGKEAQQGTAAPGRERAPAGGAEGRIPGTFSLELIHMYNEERGPDIVLTFPWSSGKNSFGFAGTDYEESSGESGPRTGTGSGHGSMSPWCIRNTMIAWGIDFKERRSVEAPAGNVDVLPTILALMGIAHRQPLDGRVLSEAFKGGPDEAKVPYATRSYTAETPDGKYSAVIQVSLVGGHRYIDKSWRTR